MEQATEDIKRKEYIKRYHRQRAVKKAKLSIKVPMPVPFMRKNPTYHALLFPQIAHSPLKNQNSYQNKHFNGDSFKENLGS